jgi:hypothetical protein
MAVKKTTKKKEESATPAKAEAKEPAPKKTAKKKAAAPKAAAEPVAAATPATPPPTPAAEPAPAAKVKKAAAKKGAAKKAAAPLKLSASQDELLKKIGAAGEGGYSVEKKEQRSIESLLDKKLIKKGAKNKATGAIPYHITSGGKKQIS